MNNTLLNKDNLSSSKVESTAQLKAMKSVLLELASKIANDEVTEMHHVSGSVWNTIEEIEEELGE